MASSFSSISLWIAAASVTASLDVGAQVLINEVDADNRGIDTLEFVELYDGGAGNTSLDDMVLVFFNGNGDASYRVVDLTGQSTNADGLFVVGGDAVAANYGIVVGLKLDPEDNVDNLIQNGADAVALLRGAPEDFPDRTPVTDIVPADILDAVVYGTNDGEDFDLVDALLLPDQFQVDEGQNGNKDNESVQRSPDGGTPRSTATYATKIPTPGALNNPTDTLTLSADTLSFSENGGPAVSTGTLTRSGPTTAEVTVSLSLQNADSQVDRTELTVPTEVVIPAGSATAQFDIDAVDDLWPDGTQTISVNASAPGYQEASPLEISVQDSGTDTFLLAINEFYPTVGLDSNGDGEAVIESTNSGGPNPDEFIEFVNPGATPLDVSGWSITDIFIDERPGFTPVHTFPAGTILDPGCAVVVFGSGVAPEGLNPNFGDAIVQNASGGQALFLNVTDRISVRNAEGIEVATVSYSDQDGFDGSSTLITEGDQSSGYQGHFIAFNGSDFSPGTMGDGTPFCQADSSLSLASTSVTIQEDAGPAAATLTITRAPGTSGDLQVTLESSDTTELDLPALATIPDGSATAQVQIDAIDDDGPDGIQTVIITAQSPGFTPGTIEIQVTDDGDIAPTNLVINEIDADQDGTDDREFIELYNPNAAPASLDGFTLVLYNGNQGGSEYNVIALSGSIPANGYFVVGGTDLIPTPDLIPPTFGISNNIQNGADAVALFVGAPALEFDGTDADPLSYPLNATLVDAVVYGTSDPEDTFLVDSLTPGGAQIDEGSGNNPNSISRSPDGSNTFAQLPPSPGIANGGAPAGFEAWAAANGAPGLGRFDDSDFDNIPAVVEYVLGLDPTQADPETLPSLVPSGSDYTITYQLGTEASGDGSVVPVIQTSDDLASWLELVTTNDGTVITATIPGDAGKLNIRLRVLQAIP